MKRQLLEDIGDNAAVPAVPPGSATAPKPQRAPAAACADGHARVRHAVWRRPQVDDAGHVIEEAAPPPATGYNEAARDPDWFAERLRQAAAGHGAAHRAGRWVRRAATWGVAGVLAAVVAAGGWWMAEEHRVAGALAVVASNDRTAVRAPADSRAPPPAPVAPLPAAAPLVEAPLVEAPSVEAPAQPEPPDDITLDTRRVVAIAIDPPRRRERPSARQAMRAHPSPPPRHVRDAASSQATLRHRREETLMQCRALGYGERQCHARGCTMTRFGLACRG